jgi:hypothetical protein
MREDAKELSSKKERHSRADELDHAQLRLGSMETSSGFIDGAHISTLHIQKLEITISDTVHMR